MSPPAGFGKDENCAQLVLASRDRRLCGDTGHHGCHRRRHSESNPMNRHELTFSSTEPTHIKLAEPITVRPNTDVIMRNCCLDLVRTKHPPSAIRGRPHSEDTGPSQDQN